MSKKKIILIGYAFMILGYFVFSARSGGVAEMLNSDSTGSPLSSGLVCSNCHSGGSFNVAANMQILDASNTPVTSYIPGQTYTMTLQVSGTAPHYGAQAVALKSDNTNAGTMGNPTTDNTQVSSIGNVSYLEHSARSSSGIFSVPWTAPISGSGDVNIYYIGNAVDGFGTSGDQATSSMVLSLIEETPSCTIAPPSGQTTEILTGTSVKFFWTTEENATFHQVRYRIKGTTDWTVAGTSNTFRTVGALIPNKYYQFKLRSQCDGGTWSDFTEIGEFYTSTCDIPLGVTSIYLNPDRVRLRWDIDPNAFKNRVAYRPVGSGIPWLLKGNTPGNNFIYLTELTPNTLYEYKVRTRCNNDEWSAFSEKFFFDTTPPMSRLSNESAIAKLYPNPSHGELNVSFETITAGDVQLVVADMNGKQLIFQDNYYEAGNNKEQLDVSQLSSGYYSLIVYSGDDVNVMKFVKY